MGGRGGSSSRGGGNAGGGGALPELTGSERQVAWANQIRGDTIDEVRADARLASDEKMAIIGVLSDIQRSSWFVDNRRNLTEAASHESLRRDLRKAGTETQDYGPGYPVNFRNGDRNVHISTVRVMDEHFYRVSYDDGKSGRYTASSRTDAVKAASTWLGGGDAPVTRPPETRRQTTDDGSSPARRRRSGFARFRRREQS